MKDNTINKKIIKSFIKQMFSDHKNQINEEKHVIEYHET